MYVNKGADQLYAMISCTVSMQLICDFVFAYVDIRFSHDVTLINLIREMYKFDSIKEIREEIRCLFEDI